MQEETKRKAEANKNKVATFGPDVDIAKFSHAEERQSINSLSELSF